MRFRRSTVVVGALGIVAVAAAGGVIVTRRTPACEPTATHPEWTVARQWDEAALDAVRRDLPAPTVHARNLYHMSAAMWDAWAAYSPGAEGVFSTEKHSARDVDAARKEAISYAAYRVLEHRYINAVGGSDSIPEFDALMESLCYPIEVITTEGDSPAAIGNRIGETIIAAGMEDGSLEADGYDDHTYEAVNQALIVAESGTSMRDPNRWQPLQIENMISQNGIPVVNGTQQFVDPHWGHVTPFAIPPGGEQGVPIPVESPPMLGDPATDDDFKDSAVQIIRFSSLLDPTDGVMIDASPASLGNNSLGTNDGSGYATNPVTGRPYQPNRVLEADFARAMAEFWADGPHSETPPGHWNVIANDAGDRLEPDLRIGGTGDPVDRLEWDVKVYLALNGANHDAAVAAWGLKRYHDYVRPISMIRYMGGLGQSSDPNGPSYDPEGLPVVPGLIEVVTEESSAPGERHAGLADHVGEVAIRAWQGTPEDRETEIGGVGWILAVDWVPYQLPTFVTPAFAAFVSGHSTFSRASAEVLTAITGSEYVPGGLGEWVVEPGGFQFEAGPDHPVELEWATYFDAADQAGLSRLYGGIHVRADDFTGRRLGHEVGLMAWERARSLYGS